MELQSTEAAPAAPEAVTTPSAPPPEPVNDTPEIKPMSASEAAKLLRSRRTAKAKEAAPVEAAPEVTQEIPSIEENAAAPTEEPTGETQAADAQPQEEAPLGPPRSWSKEQHEHWSKIDRATQEYLLAQDKQATRAINQAQHEAAEERKALNAERQSLAQALQLFEQNSHLALQHLQSNAEFADIRTQADIDHLAATDWPRYIAFDNHMKKVERANQQWQWAQQQQAAEYQENWKNWSVQQDQAFREAVPEMADEAKGQALMKASIDTLENAGFSKDELKAWWNGQAMSMRDARWQQIMLKAAKFDESQAKAKQIVAKNLPPVMQKPGVAQSKNAQADASVRTLESKLKQSGNVKDAVALLRARRAAR